ncbi:hypothetical protein HMI01_00030 [Halolactibacillus miurensis]|uniref:Uncharacterized protein n=1 Tax=Halolactibacillus miurensis TaxID=306541 RepID=A0ABQ0VR97_9BACI|nr:hypothetical protein HMI01_00030 [Halolactibacillus miurensis]
MKSIDSLSTNVGFSFNIRIARIFAKIHRDEKERRSKNEADIYFISGSIIQPHIIYSSGIG